MFLYSAPWVPIGIVTGTAIWLWLGTNYRVSGMQISALAPERLSTKRMQVICLWISITGVALGLLGLYGWGRVHQVEWGDMARGVAFIVGAWGGLMLADQNKELAVNLSKRVRWMPVMAWRALWTFGGGFLFALNAVGAYFILGPYVQ